MPEHGHVNDCGGSPVKCASKPKIAHACDKSVLHFGKLTRTSSGLCSTCGARDCYETYSTRNSFRYVICNGNGGESFRSGFENTKLLYQAVTKLTLPGAPEDHVRNLKGDGQILGASRNRRNFRHTLVSQKNCIVCFCLLTVWWKHDVFRTACRQYSKHVMLSWVFAATMVETRRFSHFC